MTAKATRSARLGAYFAAHDSLLRLWLAERRPVEHPAADALRDPQSAYLRAEARGSGYDVDEAGVAVVPIVGPLLKADSWMLEWMGGTSSARARKAINEAAADPAVRSILLRIDSPGGTVAGTADLADAVFEAAKRKTVLAHIEDMGASAAYWIAAQADYVYSNSTALVGSIGTYLVLEDFAAMYEDQGVKTHVIRAGEFKGIGTPGTEITTEQIAMLQDRVNSLNELFLAGVARGRRSVLSMAQVRQLADGRVHVGQEAADMKLTDGVLTIEQTLQRIRSS